MGSKLSPSTPLTADRPANAYSSSLLSVSPSFPISSLLAFAKYYLGGPLNRPEKFTRELGRRIASKSPLRLWPQTQQLQPYLSDFFCPFCVVQRPQPLPDAAWAFRLALHRQQHHGQATCKRAGTTRPVSHQVWRCRFDSVQADVFQGLVLIDRLLLSIFCTTGRCSISPIPPIFPAMAISSTCTAVSNDIAMGSMSPFAPSQSLAFLFPLAHSSASASPWPLVSGAVRSLCRRPSELTASPAQCCDTAPTTERLNKALSLVEVDI